MLYHSFRFQEILNQFTLKVHFGIVIYKTHTPKICCIFALLILFAFFFWKHFVLLKPTCNFSIFFGTLTQTMDQYDFKNEAFDSFPACFAILQY